MLSPHFTHKSALTLVSHDSTAIHLPDDLQALGRGRVRQLLLDVRRQALSDNPHALERAVKGRSWECW